MAKGEGDRFSSLRLSPFAVRPTPLAGTPEASLRVDRLLTLVVAAVRADAVRQLVLLAVGALGHRWRRQRVMSPTLVAAGLAVAPFRIGHDRTCSFWILALRDLA